MEHPKLASLVALATGLVVAAGSAWADMPGPALTRAAPMPYAKTTAAAADPLANAPPGEYVAYYAPPSNIYAYGPHGYHQWTRPATTVYRQYPNKDAVPYYEKVVERNKRQ